MDEGIMMSTFNGDHVEHDVQFANEMRREAEEDRINNLYELEEKIHTLERDIAECRANGYIPDADILEQELDDLIMEYDSERD